MQSPRDGAFQRSSEAGWGAFCVLSDKESCKSPAGLEWREEGSTFIVALGDWTIMRMRWPAKSGSSYRQDVFGSHAELCFLNGSEAAQRLDASLTRRDYEILQ